MSTWFKAHYTVPKIATIICIATNQKKTLIINNILLFLSSSIMCQRQQSGITNCTCISSSYSKIWLKFLSMCMLRFEFKFQSSWSTCSIEDFQALINKYPNCLTPITSTNVPQSPDPGDLYPNIRKLAKKET